MINTIALKECRQAVRSRLVTGMVLTLVLIELGAFIITLLTLSADSTSSLEAGRTLFAVLLVILTYGACVFVPVYTMVRLMTERWNDSVDLLYVAGLSPWAIVRGKLFSAGMILLLLFSAVMPFMALTYPLRGIDLFSMLAVLAVMAVCILFFTLFMLALASAGATRAHKVLNALAGIFIALMMAGLLTAGGVAALEEGLASMIATQQVLGALVMLGSIGLALAAMLYVAAATHLMPPSANRALPLRLTATGVIMFMGAVALGVAAAEGSARRLYLFALLSAGVIWALVVYVCAAPAEISVRVRRAIPRGVARLLVYPWFEGASAGFVWVLAMLGVIVAITWAGASLDKTPQDVRMFVARLAIVTVYVVSAGLLARSVWVYALRRVIPVRYVSVLAAIVLVISTLAPLLAGLWLGMRGEPAYGLWWYGNFAAIFDTGRGAVAVQRQMTGAMVGLAVMFVISLPWWLKELRAFRPLERANMPGSAEHA